MTKPFAEIYDVDARSDPFLAEYEHARGQLQTPNWREGLQDLERLAHQGSIMSILLVSDAMRSGWMYDTDLVGAETWYHVAYQSGSVRGLFGLGLTYLEMGRFSEAVEKFESAIENNFPPAYNSLAGMYFRGDGVLADPGRALALWRKGASLGHLPAKRNLVQQSLRGRFGFLGFVSGLFSLLPLALEIAKVRATNPYTDRLR